MTALLINTSSGPGWMATYDDYDGAEDSHCPVGLGRTEAAAVLDLFENNPRDGAFVKCSRCSVPVLAAALRDPARCTDACPLKPANQ